MAGMSILPMLQQMMLLQKQQQGAQPPTGVVPGGNPQMQPPQLTPPRPVMPQMGGDNQVLPTGQASPMVPGVPMSPVAPRQPGKMSAQGVALIPMAAMKIGQEMHQKKVQKYQAIAGEWLAMQQNPNAQKSLDEAAKKDPSIAKALEKKKQDFVKMYQEAIKDPNSAAAQGIQMAYRSQMNIDTMQQKFEEFQQKMKDQQALDAQRAALAQREQAQAAKDAKATEQMGTVTDAERAKLDNKMQMVTTQIKGKLDQTSMQTKAMLEAVDKRVAGSIKVAGIKEKGLNKRSNLRADTYIIQEYKAIGQQATELDRQAKDLQAHLDKTSHWYGDADDADDVRNQLAQIEAQRNVLGIQMKMLQAKDQAFQQAGLVSTPTNGDGSSQDKPIVLK